MADTLVGDLKNNIVYVSGDDNSSTYEIKLEGIQIPELVNAGLSAMFSSMNQYSSYNEDDVFLKLGTDPVVKSASLTFTVDREGRLLDETGTFTLAGFGEDGASHEACVTETLKIDYGTAKPEKIDISPLKNVDYHSAGADHSVSVDEDGVAVDEDGNAVGNIEIDENGEGKVVYND